MMKYKNVKKTQKEFDLQDRFFIRNRRTWMLMIPCSVLDVQNMKLMEFNAKNIHIQSNISASWRIYLGKQGMTNDEGTK